MKNNKGFTLVEIISVIAVLSLIIVITVPIISGVSTNIKKSIFKTKVENIEKAAILYGQDRRENFTSDCSYCEDNKTNPADCSIVNKRNGKCYLPKCKCYKELIYVSTLLDPNNDGDKKDAYFEPDKSGKVINPLDENQNLNDCKIQIYQKYGKIYAVYEKTVEDNCYYE